MTKYRLQAITGDHKERGSFNSAAWRKEAKIHFDSSQKLRELAMGHRKDALRYYEAEGITHLAIGQAIDQSHAMAKSSLLLLGYALEMGLKAGVVALFRGLPRKYLESALKSRFNHNLQAIARFVELPLGAGDLAVLSKMSDLVVAGARYPISPTDDRSYLREFNNLGATIRSDDFYDSGVTLYENIIAHAETVRGTEKDHVSHGALRIDDDGVVSYRIGGGTSNRLLVAYSSEQKREGNDNTLMLWNMLDKNVTDPILRLIIDQGVSAVNVFELK